MTNQILIDQINEALQAHTAWRMKLTTAIRMGGLDTPPTDIACDNKCAFGQWLYGPAINEETRDRKPYQVTRRLHAEFHKVASEVAELAEGGRRGEAFALLDGEFTARSETLFRALTKWSAEAKAQMEAEAQGQE